MKDANAIRFTLLIFGVGLLIVAVVLTVTDHDAAVAWAAFTGIVGAIAGQHLPSPPPRDGT